MTAGAERTRKYRERLAAGLVTPRRGPVLKPRLSPTEVLLNKLASSTPMPNLRGAACAGRASTFDPRNAGEPEQAVADRHRYAIELCGRCPVQGACATWIAALPDRERPIGVVAGTLFERKENRC